MVYVEDHLLTNKIFTGLYINDKQINVQEFTIVTVFDNI